MSKNNGDGVTELHRLYRPQDWDEMAGQGGAVRALKDLLKSGRVPQSIMFTGPSGVGKTTLARILARKLGLKAESNFRELNAAEVRGIDTVREVAESSSRKVLSGGARVWLFDECHKLTADAQNALLKMTEDPRRGVYYFFCTTEPLKVIKPLKGRCTEINLKALAPAELEALLKRVALDCGKEFEEALYQKIIKVADGSARNALKILSTVLDVEDEEEQLKRVELTDSRKKAIELARALFDRSKKWKDVASVLGDVEDEDPEGLRYMVLYYCASVIKGGGPLAKRAYEVAGCFERNYYDTKKAGLVLSCYEAMHG